MTNPNSDSLLKGKRIGFFTSVVGMGGSEVLVADAIEAAHQAGAEVVCWSESTASIRRICAERTDRLWVQHYTWPLGQPTAEPAGVAAPSRAVGRPNSAPGWKAGVRAIVPFAVKRHLGFRKTAQAFRRELERVTPDLLFVNVNGSEAVSLAGPACGVPVVNCYHLSYTRPTGGPLARYGDHRARQTTMQAGTLTIHTSVAVRDQWCQAFGYPPDRCRVIYNGVDPPPKADPSTTRRELGLPADRFVFCVPGRLDPIKGHRHLIRALELLRNRLSGVSVLVCGDGPLRAELEQQSTTAGLGDVIRFLGWRQDLPAVLQASDAVILPSVASENLSVAVLEGLMAGVPAVVSAVGGMAEAVIDGQTGYVVPPADPTTLAAALEKMFANPPVTRQMGSAAVADAARRFTRERMMAEYVAAFADVLGGRT